MAKKRKKKFKKSAKGKPRAGGALSQVAGVASSLAGGKKRAGGARRSRGPAYWANKVIVQKLKKKYFRLRYGGI